MFKILTISTLFPNQQQPNLGIFVEQQTRRLAAMDGVGVRVINPLSRPPWPLSKLSAYRQQQDCPYKEERNGLQLLRPRYFTLPALGWRFHDYTIAQAIRPHLDRMIADGFRPDVIDAEFFWPCGVAAARLARAYNIPVSIKSRGADIHYWSSLPQVRRKLLWAAKTASGCLAVSQSLKQDMVRLGMAAEKITVHYTGVDSDIFCLRDQRSARQALGLAGDESILVSVGSLIPRKGHDLALQALALLPQQKLLIAGQGPELAALKALSQSLGVAERVTFLGNRPHAELPLLYAAADVFLLCPVSEGLANVWVEALACGTPVVTTAVDGAVELITSERAGRLLTTRNPQDVAAAIMEVLRAPPSREEVRATALPFSWQRNSETLLAHLHNCASQAMHRRVTS